MEDRELTQEEAAYQKQMAERKKRVERAAKKIAEVIVEEGITALDYEWAVTEAKARLTFALPESTL